MDAKGRLTSAKISQELTPGADGSATLPDGRPDTAARTTSSVNHLNTSLTPLAMDYDPNLTELFEAVER